MASLLACRRERDVYLFICKSPGDKRHSVSRKRGGGGTLRRLSPSKGRIKGERGCVKKHHALRLDVFICIGEGKGRE